MNKKLKTFSNETLILGIDPGTSSMGFGLISSFNNQVKLLLVDELKLKISDSHYLKLKKIFEKTLSIIDEYHPDELAIEAPFFGKNIQSMLKLGRAQGIAMAAGLFREIPISEYSPRKIKQSITGRGNSSKEQVAKMLETILKIKDIPFSSLDASDGLAVALCHHLNRNSLVGLKKADLKKKTPIGSWETFVKENIHRQIK
jgi:crossover junction endodeoxyribonuclease RuvC